MKIAILPVTIALALAAPEAQASTLDKKLSPIVAAYLSICQTLAADKTDGVQKRAAAIAKWAKAIGAKDVPAAHKKHLSTLGKKLQSAAKKLALSKEIAAQREALKHLSRPLVLWVTVTKKRDLNVMYCSMAKGSWLQRSKTIANPYYGSKMLRCGRVVQGKHQGHADGHMKGGHK